MRKIYCAPAVCRNAATLEQAMASYCRYKEIRAMSFLPSVECGKFKLKKAFQSGGFFACTKKSEICATSTLKLIKTMLKCHVA